jgi:hypothetical protein
MLSLRSLCIHDHLLNSSTNLYETRSHITAPEPIWTAYFIYQSLQSVCLQSMCPISLLGNGKVKKSNALPLKGRGGL